MRVSITGLQHTKSHQDRQSALGPNAHLEISNDKSGDAGAEQIHEYVVRCHSTQYVGNGQSPTPMG